MTADREWFNVSTAQHVAIGFDVAGLGDRFAAALLDYAVLLACGGALQLGLRAISGGVWGRSLFLLGLLPLLVYFPVCELVFNGQTLGKWAWGLRVMRTSGAEPTLGDFLLRWILRPIDLWATSGLAAVTTILYTGTGQRLGDLAAGTTVVETRTRTTLDDTLFAPVDDDHEPLFRDARTLDPDDVTTARRVLRRLSDADGRPNETVHTLAERTRQALLRKMDATTDLAPEPFLETVLRDYNYYQRESVK